MRQLPFAAAIITVAIISGALGAIVGISAASPAYPKGDMNCDSLVTLGDSLDIVKFKAGLPISDAPGGCDAIGSLPGSSPTVPVTTTSAPTNSPSPSPTQTTTHTPTPTPHSGSTFGDGTWLVGSEVQPGLYRNSNSSGGCYWARLSGLGGTLDEIIANNFTNSIDTVQIHAGDLAFESDRCGTWSQNLLPPSSGSTQPFQAGTWLVGEEVAPGTWRNSDSSGDCYWARLSGFDGTLANIISNNIDTTIQTVQIGAGDAGFTSDRCGTWTKIG